MAAGMGDRHLVAVGIGDGHGARVGRAGVFPDGQGVQFGPEQNGGPGTVGQDANHSRAADAGLDRGAIFLQPPGTRSAVWCSWWDSPGCRCKSL